MDSASAESSSGIQLSARFFALGAGGIAAFAAGDVAEHLLAGLVGGGGCAGYELAQIALRCPIVALAEMGFVPQCAWSSWFPGRLC